MRPDSLLSGCISSRCGFRLRNSFFFYISHQNTERTILVDELKDAKFQKNLCHSTSSNERHGTGPVDSLTKRFNYIDEIPTLYSC